MAAEYRLIHNSDASWCYAAKKISMRDGDEIQVLYEGDCTTKALRAILKDLGVTVKGVERKMSDEGYCKMRLSDWDK